MTAIVPRWPSAPRRARLSGSAARNGIDECLTVGALGALTGHAAYRLRDLQLSVA